MRLATGLLLALAASVVLNGSFYVQHEAASGLPPVSLRRPLHSLRLLFTDLRWFAGWLAGWLGWGLYILALRFAALSLAQAVAAGGVGLIAFLAARRGRMQLSRRERLATVACLAGLALVAASLAGRQVSAQSHDWRPVAAWVVACVLLAGLSVVTSRRVLAAGAGLGAAGGLLYAGGDIATKAAVSSVGLVFVAVLLACHLLGFVALQLSFQRGNALATAGLSTLLNNTVPIAAGLVVFHEGLPAGVFGAVRVIGFLAVVLGAALIARPEGSGPAVLHGGATRAGRCEVTEGGGPRRPPAAARSGAAGGLSSPSPLPPQPRRPLRPAGRDGEGMRDKDAEADGGGLGPKVLRVELPRP